MSRALFALLLGLGLIGPAIGHSWYDGACCSGQDCSALPLGSVQFTPDGWRIEAGAACREWNGSIACTTSAETIPLEGDKRLRSIPPEAEGEDAQIFHGCVQPVWNSGKVVGFKLRCLYAPGGGL